VEIKYEQKAFRMRPDQGLAGLHLSLVTPSFYHENALCSLPTEAACRLIDALCLYIKDPLRQKISQEYGARHGINAEITLKVYRIDEKILSFRISAAAHRKGQTLYEKHLYFLYTDCGRRPLFKREAVKGKCRCLYIEGNTACDPLTGKRYPIKKKFRI
jgi:hypothetical protein